MVACLRLRVLRLAALARARSIFRFDIPGVPFLPPLG
jgi:hypothetical protein